MKYKIIRTDKADEQLREIIFYIADDSGSIDIALNYLNKIETAINFHAVAGRHSHQRALCTSALPTANKDTFLNKRCLFFTLFFR